LLIRSFVFIFDCLYWS